jgi:hypothetical protein
MIFALLPHVPVHRLSGLIEAMAERPDPDDLFSGAGGAGRPGSAFPVVATFQRGSSAPRSIPYRSAMR